MARHKSTSGNLALDPAEKRVIVINATEETEPAKIRVAAYTRVSSDSDDQMNSFAAQNTHYTTLISNNPDWQMVGLYADGGITGTSAEKRPDFQRLISDCKKGKIDRIVVKSISRFARNTRDCLEITRQLRSIGVGVYFEEQNIDTAKVSGEMLTAIFAALAQKESESISENMRWSYQKRMKSGKFITCKAPYGYRLVNNTLEVEPSEAKIIRDIFTWYLNGDSVGSIATRLTKANIPSRDKKGAWSAFNVLYILKNEKYIGDALLQKRYTTPLPYLEKRNHGEYAQYYVEGSHPSIISRDVYQQAQVLLERKKSNHNCVNKSDYAFSRKLVCGHCGSIFKRRVDKGIVYWVCRNHQYNHNQCPLQQIRETEIMQAFLRLFYKLKHHPELLSGLLSNLRTIRRNRMLWSLGVIELNKQISNLSDQNRLLAELQKQGLVDPDIFISRSNELAEQLRKAKQEKERLIDLDSDDRISQTRDLIEVIAHSPKDLWEFDRELFSELVDKIIVDVNYTLHFQLKNGLELPEDIERRPRSCRVSDSSPSAIK